MRAVGRATSKSSVDKNLKLRYSELIVLHKRRSSFVAFRQAGSFSDDSQYKNINMPFFPKKVASRREVFWLTVQVCAYAFLSTIVAVTLMMKITGKEVPGIYLYAFSIPWIVAPPISYWLANSIYEITRLGDEIERIAYVDDLTGIANRRAFFERAPALIEQSTNPDETISVILIDIDNFKRINDTYGHKAGDAVLVFVADILTRHLQDAKGFGARIGGEEFVLLLIHKDMTDVITLADKIRLSVKNAAIDTRNSLVSATISIGLAQHSAGDDLDNTLLRADKALYLAKNAGRDRVVGLMAEVSSVRFK